MNINQIKEKANSEEYSFLREEPLGNNIVLLGLGGSHAYGMDNENSDLDVRGIAANPIRNILTHTDFEQVTHLETDTTIYSLDKMLSLLSGCNPNTIEILGLKPEHYLYVDDIGKELLKNKQKFLSKQCIYTFGEYAKQQLRRLENKSARVASQTDMERHILDTLEGADKHFKERYFEMPDDAINLYIAPTTREGYDTEIFMDVNLSHYPLRDFKDMWSEMHAIVKSYLKIGKRNRHAIEHDKLGKHMAHIVRLYFMLFDILKDGEIITYREKEHDLLMSIRNGEYLDDNKQPIKAFYDLSHELKSKMADLAETTKLPDEPDLDWIKEFQFEANKSVVVGERRCEFCIK